MTSNNDKTLKSFALFAFAIGVCAVLLISMGGVMAADKTAKNEEIAVASVKFVDEDSGVLLLEVDKTRKVADLARGDEIEIVLAEETEEMKNQRPRRWRMMRHPFGGPSDQ